ncbi:MAG: copper homeostasis protein CutC [Bacteroidales bacterium]|jgi:copper homeostasis protein|nr:copper homeostasis protein CutC [Bacteroidales bacterium]
MEFRLEICVDSIESAISAFEAGADRLELCSALSEGGITPSYGMILSARKNFSAGLHVLIRPRGGDFLYSDSEFGIMKRDIEFCRESGVDGVVFGILLPDGNIDTVRTSALVKLSSPMAVTFHRAFDLCRAPERGLEDIIASGASRLLTSGQKNSAGEGAGLIGKLVRQAGKRIIIMPGGGLDLPNIEMVARKTGASEFHMTARKSTGSKMTWKTEGIPMGGPYVEGEYTRKVADPEKIKDIINILKMI